MIQQVQSEERNAGDPGFSGRIEVREYTPRVSTSWDNYVHHSKSATFCHLSGWIRVIEKTWRHLNRSLYAEIDGSIVGVLPLFHVKSRLFGSMLVSSPNAVYGGVAADGASVYESLMNAAKDLARELQVDYLELREPGIVEQEKSDAELNCLDLYHTFECPIVADEDALIRNFPRDIRRMIRLGPKNGLSSELGGEELLEDFYDVYAASVRNLGTPVFPKKLFQEFLREFKGSCDILAIRRGAEVAGAVMNFYFRDATLPYYGGAYSRFNRAGVNNFMYWELMRSAAAKGFSVFDFGRSKANTGAYEFKRGWGMKQRPLPYKFFLVRAGRMPSLNPANPKFKLMIAAWKRLPLGVTKILGPRIVRNLP